MGKYPQIHTSQNIFSYIKYFIYYGLGNPIIIAINRKNNLSYTYFFICFKGTLASKVQCVAQSLKHSINRETRPILDVD